MQPKRFIHIHFGDDPSTKAKRFFQRMKEKDQVTEAVVGVHYDPRQYVKLDKPRGIQTHRIAMKVRAISLWLRPHLFVFTFRK